MLVRKGGQKAKDATVTRAHASLEDYDILYKDGKLEKAVPVRLLRDKRVTRHFRVNAIVYAKSSGWFDPFPLCA